MILGSEGFFDQPSGWRTVSVAGAAFSQPTGLAALPTDEANGEIRAILNNGLNITGEILNGGVVSWSIVDAEGRAVGAGVPGRLEVRFTAITQPLAGGNVQVGVGLHAAASMAALAALPRYMHTSIDYAATRRSVTAYRTGTLNQGQVLGATVSRVVASTDIAIGATGSCANMQFVAATPGAFIGGAIYMLQSALFGVGPFRVYAYFGSISGAVSGSAAERTVGGRFEYRFTRYTEDLI